MNFLNKTASYKSFQPGFAPHMKAVTTANIWLQLPSTVIGLTEMLNNLSKRICVLSCSHFSIKRYISWKQNSRIPFYPPASLSDARPTS